VRSDQLRDATYLPTIAFQLAQALDAGIVEFFAMPTRPRCHQSRYLVIDVQGATRRSRSSWA
jgi:hypothetical protein